MLVNHVEKIPGSTVTASLAHSYITHTWYYTLWDNYPDNKPDNLVATGEFWAGQLPDYVTPNQVARIAFLLEVEYKSS